MKKQIYNYIQQYIFVNKYSPTVREICKGVGLYSTNTVHRYLHILKADGRIDFKDNCPRTISIKD